MSDTPGRTPDQRSKGSRLHLVVLGPALIILSPVIGLLPGPGGVVVFAVGLGFTLRHIRVAKRTYVRVKRRWPYIGRLSDMSLRRPSHIRRERKKNQSGNSERLPE